MSEKKYQNVNIEKVAGSKVKITGETTIAAFEQAQKKATKEFVENIELPGFRVGKAPEAMVVKQVGEMRILERAASSMIDEVYGQILNDNPDIRAIGQPSVSVTKLAAGNPLGFIIETAVMPEITLKNYEKISSEAAEKIAPAPEKIEQIEEKEIDNIIEDVRKRVAIEMAASAKHNHAHHDHVGHDHSHDNIEKDEKVGTEKTDTEAKQILPEVNDEFVKKFGNFETVAAFREHTKKSLFEHKKHEVADKRRGAIADALIQSAQFEVPDLFIESELDTMIGQFRADVERNGMTFDDYLKATNKTADDIRKEWRSSAERRARLELILKHIAREEKISPDEAVVKKEVDHIMSHHKGADRFTVRMFIENQLKNKLVFEFLENKTAKK